MDDQLGRYQASDAHQPSQADAEDSVPYQLPAVELLNEPSPADALQITANDLLRVQGTIIDRLASVGVEVEPGDITCGCNVTRYEIRPVAGVGVEKIRRHKHDIAMAIRTEDYRLLTPVPGKESVGIEIANQQVQKVTLRELLESDEWVNTDAKIPLLLGRDIESHPVLIDLDRQPHLLIAGNIGSGKSVCLHTIIACLLYRFAPDQIRLVIIDPDVLEMVAYNALPHLVLPVITETPKARLGIRWVIEEIEQRYRIFSKARGNVTADENTQESLPRMVVIVTELSSLFLDNADEFEQVISRIAKIGHLVGVHLIVATRVLHPDVIRPAFKLNIPSRIAFQVSKEKDSRLLLDDEGAERLQGQGDMFYRPPDSAPLCQIQGTFVADDEIRRLAKFVSGQALPEIPPLAPDHEPDEVSEEDDELVQKCIDVMKQERMASSSLFQRRLRLGYTRAARIVDLLEQRGYIGSGEGARPREILVNLDDLI